MAEPGSQRVQRVGVARLELATEVEVPIDEVEGHVPSYLIGGEAEQPDEEYIPYPFDDEPARQKRIIQELRARMTRMDKGKEEAEAEVIANLQEDLDALKKRVAQASAMQGRREREAAQEPTNLTGIAIASPASEPQREAAGASARADSRHADAKDGRTVRPEPAPAAAVAPNELSPSAPSEEDTATKAARAAQSVQRAAARRAKTLIDATAKTEAAQAAAAAAAAEAAFAKANLQAARKAAAERLRLRKERERREAEAAEAAEAKGAAVTGGSGDEALRAAAERCRVEKEKKDEAVAAAKVTSMSTAQLQKEAEDAVSSLIAQHQAEANEIQKADEMQEREAERMYAEADNKATRQAEAQLASMLTEVRGLEAMQLSAAEVEEEGAGVDTATGGGPLSRQKSVLRRGSTGSVAPNSLGSRGPESTHARRGGSRGVSHSSSRGRLGDGSPSNQEFGGEGTRGDATAPPAGEAAEADALMAPIMEQLRKLESTWEEWAGSDGATPSALSRAAVELQKWASWQEKSGLGATLGSLQAPSASVGSAVADSIALLDRALSLPYEPWEKLAKRVKPWQAKPGSSAAVNLEALRSYRRAQLELIAARINLPDRPKLPPVEAQIAAAQRTRDNAGRGSLRKPSKPGQPTSLHRSETTSLIRAHASGQAVLRPLAPAKAQPMRQRSSTNLSAGACALERPDASGWNSSRLAADACAWSLNASASGLSVRRNRSSEQGGSGYRDRGGGGGTDCAESGGRERARSELRQLGGGQAELSFNAVAKVPPAPKETRSKAHVLAANEAARSREVATALFWSAKDGR